MEAAATASYTYITETITEATDFTTSDKSSRLSTEGALTGGYNLSQAPSGRSAGDFLTLRQVFAEPVAMSSFGNYVAAHCSPIASSVFFFCMESDTLLQTEGYGESSMIHRLLKSYLIPGAKEYIGGELLPLLDADSAFDTNKAPSSAVRGLLIAGMEWLDKEAFSGYLDSNEFECLLGISTTITDKDRHPLAKAPERVVAFSLTKVNERGRKQNRTLSLGPDRIESLRGDTVRFVYGVGEVHGIVLHPEKENLFKLACIHYYEYECESEEQRRAVSNAFQSLGLGRVLNRGIATGGSMLEIHPEGIATPGQARSSHDGLSGEAGRQAGGSAKVPAPVLTDFETVGMAGSGAYAEVRIVLHKGTKRKYAMKIMKIPNLIQRKQIDRVMAEKRILSSLSHPFLVRLHSCFIDSNRLCMCLDWAEGGDLFQHLHRMQGARVSPAAAAFYVAEMVMALEYLHNHDVIHRDLKPENILLASDGHLLLTDFGLSKMDVTSMAGEHTEPGGGGYGGGGHPLVAASSMVGTKEYVAPEVVMRRPYGKAVDWWAVGVLLYELIVGRTPFEGRSGHIFDHIVAGKVPRPSRGGVFIPDLAWELILGLLRVDPSKRFGARDIREHPFYTEILKLDWDQLEEKDLPPPIRPKLREPKPLNPRQRAYSEVSNELKLTPSVAAEFDFHPVGGGSGDVGLGGCVPSSAGQAAPGEEDTDDFNEPGMEWF